MEITNSKEKWTVRLFVGIWNPFSISLYLTLLAASIMAAGIGAIFSDRQDSLLDPMLTMIDAIGGRATLLLFMAISAVPSFLYGRRQSRAKVTAGWAVGVLIVSGMSLAWLLSLLKGLPSG